MTDRLSPEAKEILGGQQPPKLVGLITGDPREEIVAGKWQLIETAPRNGTKFLAYGRGSGEKMIYDPAKDMLPEIRVCWWIAYEIEAHVVAGDGVFRKVKKMHDLGWKGGIHFVPTHWMPLPKPPATPSVE